MIVYLGYIPWSGIAKSEFTSWSLLIDNAKLTLYLITMFWVFPVFLEHRVWVFPESSNISGNVFKSGEHNRYLSCGKMCFVIFLKSSSTDTCHKKKKKVLSVSSYQLNALHLPWPHKKGGNESDLVWSELIILLYSQWRVN